MIKIIKHGFLPVNNDLKRGKNVLKGQKLVESGHVFDVTEIVDHVKDSVITGKIVAQASNVYDVKIKGSFLCYLDSATREPNLRNL